MAINQKGAVIPYQPTYSIQYKYGDRYGPQSFASPTTSLAPGQTKGPLSGDTLDVIEEEGEMTNPLVSAEEGEGDTLDSKAKGAPGGTGGANFSELVARQYTPAQPDFGWQYAHNYGNDPTNLPSIRSIFDTPEEPPVTGFGDNNIGSPDGGDNSEESIGLSPEVNSPTGEYVSIDLLDDIQSINENMGVGTSGDLGGGTGAGYTSPGGGGYGTEGTDPSSDDAYGGIDGAADAAAAAQDAQDVAEEENAMSENNDSDGGGGSGGGGTSGGGSSSGPGGATEGVGEYNMGALILPREIPQRLRDNNIPNPLLQDPLADLFRRV